VSATGRQPKLAGVLGWPLGHTLSPKLHGHWLREYDVNGIYVPFPVRKEDFSQAVRTLRRARFAGVNVTLPHKEAAFALAHGHDEAAAVTRAANLLIFRDDGRIEARNTDAYGFSASVADALGPDALRSVTAVVLGAGGAARAVVLAIDRLGAASIGILNRSRAKAETLVSELGPLTRASLGVAPESRWKELATQTAILVNATSAGLNAETSISLSLDLLPPSCAVCDLVYNPLETEFLKQARKRGLKTIDGLGMLMYQAVPSFAAFFGPTPAVTPALRRELEALQT
jgi:shikimate dehydrogenase